MTSTLRLDLTWDDATATGDAATATWGRLRVRVGDASVWGGHDGTRWTWIDLLEHLGAHWLWLTTEEGWPAGIQPRDPTEFDVEARRSIDRCPPLRRLQRETALFEFAERHDLARSMHGAVAKPLWWLREGRSAWIATGAGAFRVDFTEARATFEQLGDRIAARVRACRTDARAHVATSAWKRRDEHDAKTRLSVASGIPVEHLRTVFGHDIRRVAGGDPSESELVAVARMAAPVVRPGTLHRIVEQVHAAAPRRTPALDELSVRALGVCDTGSMAAPHEQGIALARWLRGELGHPDRVDPDELLRRWNVDVTFVDLGDPLVDAIAAWGPSHGPIVIVNTIGRHAQRAPGRRATLAHEIAHLLVDRRDALPLAEVFGGRAPLRVEQRARAFAAELLIPQVVAGSAFVADDEPSQVLRRLSRRYGASYEVISWQVRNSDTDIPERAERYLRGYVSAPGAW